MRPLILILFMVIAIPAAAAGFGKNKVQYQRMDWAYLKAPHYTLYYHQDQGALPEMSYLWINDAYRDLAKRFRFIHPSPVPIIIYESPALFEQTNIITELLPEEVGGFTEIFKNRVAVPFNGSFSDLRHVLHHEMVHAFVFGAIYEGSIFRAASANVPLWFNEGLAELLSTGWDRSADMFMIDRVLHSNIPPPGPMLDGYMAYKGGQSFLYYLYSTGGDSTFNALLHEFRLSRTAEPSIEKVYKNTMEELGRSWISELRRLYWPEIGRRTEPSDQASAVTVNTKDRSRFNLRPRISPDGQKIAFFSDKKDYARIIITDPAGKELGRIGQHSISGSFESFQPFNGAIAWSADGSELAFIAKRGGRNEIRFVNASTGKKSRGAVRLPLSAIYGLDWSKDGNRLAFTAVSFGQPDLYMYDLTTLELSILVDSHHSKSSPRFSPDGKKIIFTLTDTAGLGIGPLTSHIPQPTSNIALYDIEKEGYRLLSDTKWNDRQPAFSPDGSEFVFVSDRNGIDNLYIASVNNPGNPRPLTDYTGNCGNPDWAADGSAIVFDLFMNQAWNIWRMEKPSAKILKDSVLAPTRWAEHEADPSIPFFVRRVGNDGSDGADSVNAVNAVDGADTTSALNLRDTVNAVDRADTVKTGRKKRRNNNNSDISAPASDPFTSPWRRQRPVPPAVINTSISIPTVDEIPEPEPYKLRFSPDMVLFGLGLSTYSGASGQAIAMFSDIMGDHRITLAGDVQADFSEYAQIFTAYEYLKHRVGITVGAFYYKYYSYDGHFRRYFHDMETGGILGLRYPFSIFSRADLQLYGRYMERLPYTGPADMGIIENHSLLASSGYTFDNILWGITGPLNGVRASARLHLAPPLSFTDEAYLSGDVDIRQYTHLFRRFVWANRLTFGGTVGLDDNRAARRFFLGGNENWIYYDVNVNNYDDNLTYSYYSDIVSPLRGWSYFDITGDRMMLMNSEFRFPFIREITAVWPIPLQIRYINGAVFIDAGYAWTHDQQNEKFNPLPVPPKLMGGYGFGMRANLGIFVLRYDRGWPTDWKATGRPVNYFSLGAEF
ncbi:MAG: BamA/TamA family outer membrane protein [Chitinispirillia bacterium]|nr:BamA/TamA family outer membrane protein [Chitinispirillia bacterium]